MGVPQQLDGLFMGNPNLKWMTGGSPWLWKPFIGSQLGSTLRAQLAKLYFKAGEFHHETYDIPMWNLWFSVSPTTNPVVVEGTGRRTAEGLWNDGLPDLATRLAGNMLESIKTSLTETMVSATKLVRIQCYYTRMGQKFDTLKLMSACSGFNRLLATGIYIYTLCIYIYIYTHIIM